MSIWGWRNHTIEIEWNSIWFEQLNLTPSYYLTIAAIPKIRRPKNVHYGGENIEWWRLKADRSIESEPLEKKLCSSWCSVGLRDGNPDFGPSTFCRKVMLKGKLEHSELLRMLVGRASFSKTGSYNAYANCPQQYKETFKVLEPLKVEKWQQAIWLQYMVMAYFIAAPVRDSLCWLSITVKML